jgi:hypothetical protein
MDNSSGGNGRVGTRDISLESYDRDGFNGITHESNGFVREEAFAIYGFSRIIIWDSICMVGHRIFAARDAKENVWNYSTSAPYDTVGIR